MDDTGSPRRGGTAMYVLLIFCQVDPQLRCTTRNTKALWICYLHDDREYAPVSSYLANWLLDGQTDRSFEEGKTSLLKPAIIMSLGEVCVVARPSHLSCRLEPAILIGLGTGSLHCMLSAWFFSSLFPWSARVRQPVKPKCERDVDF